MLVLVASSVDLISALRLNDVFGVLCLLALSMLSLSSVTLIVYKLPLVWKARAQSNRFQKIVDQEGTWEALFSASRQYTHSPLANLLKETYVECRLENWFDGKGILTIEHRLEIAKATIEGVLNRIISAEERRLNSKLIFLSTVSTVAPFIGLLGTVWGVLGAFQALGNDGSAALTTLAPGISTALLTTIFGLVAAIPALLAHNYLTNEVYKLLNSMESFSHSIENAVRKQILYKDGKTKG